jgi:hypothetical protein
VTAPNWREFPFDLFRHELPGPRGERVRAVAPWSMTPPFPWGQWLYGQLLEERRELDGDVMETGVGRGGMSLFLALELQALGISKRVLAADSFAGLPPPRRGKDNAYFSAREYGREGGMVGIEQELWLAAASLGVPSGVEAIPGFFEDTLPDVEEALRLCFLHIDADLYDSVLCALEQLYGRVVDGGVIAIDDFFHPSRGPARAAEEFFGALGESPTFHVSFPYGVFLIKSHVPRRSRRSLDGNAYSLDALRRDAAFTDAVAMSAARSSGRRRRNAELLLDVLRAPDEGRSIYDYWRSLEEFWEWVDVMPEERSAHRI